MYSSNESEFHSSRKTSDHKRFRWVEARSDETIQRADTEAIICGSDSMQSIFSLSMQNQWSSQLR